MRSSDLNLCFHMSAEEFMPFFGKKVRKYRKIAKMTQQKLADLCGLSKQLISKIETGKSMVSGHTFLVILDVLDIPLSEIVSLNALENKVYSKQQVELLRLIKKYDFSEQFSTALMTIILENVKGKNI